MNGNKCSSYFGENKKKFIYNKIKDGKAVDYDFNIEDIKSFFLSKKI